MATQTTPMKSTVSPGISSVRLAVARKSMSDANDLAQVIAAKDKAKTAGLTEKDTNALRLEFDKAKARFTSTRHV